MKEESRTPEPPGVQEPLRPPDPLLLRCFPLLEEASTLGPVLDLACGRGRNGLYLASRGLPVVFADASEEALSEVRERGSHLGITPCLWQVDLEQGEADPLPQEAYGAILVFRYLHRPLVPAVRGALRPRGLLLYETYTTEQVRFGRPRNPRFLLQPGELLGWFRDWQVLHVFEGILRNPDRAVAQIVCRRPSDGGGRRA